MQRLTWAIVPVLLSLVLGPPGVHATEYVVEQKNPVAADTNPGTAEQPWKTIGKAAAVMQAGDRVTVHAGLYREYVEPKNSGRPGAPIIYEGAAGEEVVLTGADLLTGWQRIPGERPIYQVPWEAKFIINTVNGKPIYHHPGDEEHVRSGRAEQIVVDGQAWDWPQLVLSLDDMKAGTFFPDVEKEMLYLWLADGGDPNAHQVEGCTRGMIFGTNPWARPKGFDYVTARGFTSRYCATFPQRPAAWLLGKGNVLEDCTVEWTSGGGAGVGPEDGVMRRCVVRNCGHVGGCAGGTRFLNEDCTWEGNCRKPINRGWDAGGVKLCLARHGSFDRCVFRNNGGPGLWFDIDVADVAVRNCLFADNEGCGLFIEISRDVYVLNSAFLRNGLRATGATWSIGGLTLAESRNCILANNLIVGNLDGLTLREQGPRYLDTDDLGKVPFENVNHVIVNNVSALNKNYQLGLWYDSAFFGRHPGEMEKYKTEDEFETSVKRDRPDTWFDPLKQGMLIDRNWLYPGEASAGSAQAKLVLYGVPWRVRHQEFTDLAAFAQATGFEAHGEVADPGLKSAGEGLWVLPPDSPAFVAGVGPRQPFAGL